MTMKSIAIESKWLIAEYDFVLDSQDSLSWIFSPDETSHAMYTMTFEGYAWILYKGRKNEHKNTHLSLQEFRYENDFKEFWKLLFKNNVY